MQTITPRNLSAQPNKQALVDEFVGRPLGALRTPAFVIDRAVFAKNCSLMHENAKEWGAAFRAHIKTHKVRKYHLRDYPYSE
jgi:D-serine ammonia-lyase